MQSYQAQLLISEKSILGEGPLWDATKKTLYFVDIESKKIRYFRPETKELNSWQVKDRVGCIVPVSGGGILAGVTNQLVYFETEETSGKEIETFNLKQGFRFNDGKCDPKGRLWVGTMAADQSMEGAKGGGALYQIESGKSPVEVLDNMTIPNGLAWSEDQKTFYHIDTATGSVWAYPYDVNTAQIQKGSPVLTFEPEEGGPDGMCIDANGMLWIALWGGYKVVCCNPNTGERLAEVSVPAENVSCCCFGGEEMNELFITTAQNDSGNGGEVFWVKLPVKGTMPFPFQL